MGFCLVSLVGLLFFYIFFKNFFGGGGFMCGFFFVQKFYSPLLLAISIF